MTKVKLKAKQVQLITGKHATEHLTPRHEESLLRDRNWQLWPPAEIKNFDKDEAI